MSPDSYIGRFIDFDKAYGYQCVDLVNQFVTDRGLPRFTGGAAADMFGQSPGAYTWVYNTPNGVPPEGAIVVWNRGIGPYGHIALGRKGSTPTVLKTVDQNWAGRPEARAVDHNYNAVIGWGIPKINQQGDDGMGVPNKVYDAVVNDNYLRGVEINNLKNDIKGLTAERDNWKNQVGELKKEVETLKAEVVKLQASQGKSEDTELLNNFGKLLVKLITRLGISK